MIGISAWMAAEQPDPTEPVSFYVAGALGWSDPQLIALRRQQQAGLGEEHLYPTPEALQIDEG